MPSSPALRGLLPLRAASSAVLHHVGRDGDPVAEAKARYRLLWQAIVGNPTLAERIGGRLFIREEKAKLDALAVALGLAPAVPKPSRARRVAPLSNQAAAA
ncbi:hypothetical protein [Roseomonas sp. BN140053]|uniref:hypothetical protein n=1 Tax=Roseomonas sp. BN140053 TaxID=3391898 RepID=UPI0039E8441B